MPSAKQPSWPIAQVSSQKKNCGDGPDGGCKAQVVRSELLADVEGELLVDTVVDVVHVVFTVTDSSACAQFVAATKPATTSPVLAFRRHDNLTMATMKPAELPIRDC